MPVSVGPYDLAVPPSVGTLIRWEKSADRSFLSLLGTGDADDVGVQVEDMISFITECVRSDHGRAAAEVWLDESSAPEVLRAFSTLFNSCFPKGGDDGPLAD